MYAIKSNGGFRLRSAANLYLSNSLNNFHQNIVRPQAGANPSLTLCLDSPLVLHPASSIRLRPASFSVKTLPIAIILWASRIETQVSVSSG